MLYFSTCSSVYTDTKVTFAIVKHYSLCITCTPQCIEWIEICIRLSRKKKRCNHPSNWHFSKHWNHILNKCKYHQWNVQFHANNQNDTILFHTNYTQIFILMMFINGKVALNNIGENQFETTHLWTIAWFYVFIFGMNEKSSKFQLKRLEICLATDWIVRQKISALAIFVIEYDKS